jgi:hypothetical protein
MLSLAILLALPAAGLSELLFFCNMSGEIGPKCCCEHADIAMTDGPSLSEASCCKEVSVQASAASAVAETAAPTSQFDGLVARLEDFAPRTSIAVDQSLAEPGAARALPPPSLRIFVANCSYIL